MGENNLAAVAIDLAAYGVVMKLNGQPGEAVIAVRQAYAAALSEWSGLLVSVELRPPREVTRLAHAEHFLFKLGRNALSVEARNDGVQQAVGHLRRFPMIGALCKMVAPMLDDERRAEFIIDISDGSDCGARPGPTRSCCPIPISSKAMAIKISVRGPPLKDGRGASERMSSSGAGRPPVLASDHGPLPANRWIFTV
jgi:hypothetical protein